MNQTKTQNILKRLPNKPGVYSFYNSDKELIYVGKAASLKNRVKSYFQGRKSPRPIEEMIHEVANIKWEETDSALEAVILEAIIIKKHLPKYNILGRDDKSWNYIAITRDEFPKVATIRQHELNQLEKSVIKQKYSHLFGPFPGLNTLAAMKILRRLFKFSTCSPGQKRPCFHYQLKQCLGVCVGEISKKEYQQKVIRPLVIFLQGKKKSLIKKLEKEMKEKSKLENFEEARRLRDQIFNLKKIHDVALLNKSFVEIENMKPQIKNIRIEGYDISNFGETGKVGSMVVFDQESAIKSEYRKFKIKTVAGQSDVGCLAEVIDRRLRHDDWPLPYLFLIDGGKPQVNKVKKILEKNVLAIPIVGIAKGKERKKNEFFIVNAGLEKEEWIRNNFNLLIRVRDEAHRFAIKYQKQLRNLNGAKI
ncbi:GIY-YIG nuclease family protein [Patescibacteria group bacterium]|nr:GIY-YIG nuclease family protein [Patescibacteria group bacterium]